MLREWALIQTFEVPISSCVTLRKWLNLLSLSVLTCKMGTILWRAVKEIIRARNLIKRASFAFKRIFVMNDTVVQRDEGTGVGCCGSETRCQEVAPGATPSATSLLCDYG